MDKGNMMTALHEEFRRIKKQHSQALRKTAARVVLGPSVMRVYTSGTKDKLLSLLPTLDIDRIIYYKNQKQFSAWFDQSVSRVAKVISLCNPRNTRIRPGIKWGHATKIMALYVRELVLNSRYFSDSEAEKISPFLHVPIDGVVIGRLRKLGLDPPFRKIKEIDMREKFYLVQENLASAALAQGVPRIWFDDNWGDRQ